MESILTQAIQTIQQSEIAFSKYITANDTGTTGSHQAGFHIHQQGWPLFFDSPGIKGNNKDHFVTIRWQNDFETSSRFIYYGVGTRNEYRLTRFGKGFPFLTDENIGNLLILAKRRNDFYDAFVLHTDEEIDDFLATFNISPNQTNGIIPKAFKQTAEESLLQCFTKYVKSLTLQFPTTEDLATNSRNCFNAAHKITIKQIQINPDKQILGWLDAEFQLFKMIENERYSHTIKTPFLSVEELIETANTILNRRKSRAGKSLEHHLAQIFNINDLLYSTQVKTEGNKKPDFLFPGQNAYLNPQFNTDKLFMLASKTTCKDRWRQILNEADRIRVKHLFTLQQGISTNQLEEMYKYGVRLVVPKKYLSSFPLSFQSRILTLEGFINQIKSIQA